MGISRARQARDLVKEVAIQAAVLDRFEQVRRLDPLRRRQIGDGSRYFEDAIIGPRRQGELLHRLLKQVAQGGINRAVCADLRVRHAGVGERAGAFEAGELMIARGLHAGADRGGGFAGFFIAEFGDGQGRGFDVQVDAVEQRTADARPVTLDLCGRTTAFVARVAEITAGAGVHRRDEHKVARKGIGLLTVNQN